MSGGENLGRSMAMVNLEERRSGDTPVTMSPISLRKEESWLNHVAIRASLGVPFG
jgi:hypothetical protein